MSWMSAVLDIFMLFRSVRYPFGSTTVWPDTLSEARSSLRPSMVPRPAPTAVRSVAPPAGVSSPEPTTLPAVSFSAAAWARSVSGTGVYCICFLRPIV